MNIYIKQLNLSFLREFLSLEMWSGKITFPTSNICFIREFSLLRILKMQIMATFAAAVSDKDFPTILFYL